VTRRSEPRHLDRAEIGDLGADHGRRDRAVTDQLGSLEHRQSRPRQAMPGQIFGSTRGIALISVLWIAGLLAIMAASFASASRTEARLARNQLENAKAEALADAGVHRAALGLLERDPQRVWKPDGRVYRFTLGEGDVQVLIRDEDGKIDLNEASGRSRRSTSIPRRLRPWPSGSATFAIRTAIPSRSAPRTQPTSGPAFRMARPTGRWSAMPSWRGYSA
jgi:Type II secretion system (T2SS), protein K